MRLSNVPATGPRYWTALCVASVFGANMGDFVSRILHLGHYLGLAPLAVILALILLAERGSRWTTELFYWLAIVTLRTAATNLGDLLTHDFKLGFELSMGCLTAILVVIIATENLSPARRTDDDVATGTMGVPMTNAFYWAAMLTAGTLGTVMGDYVADIVGLGNGGSAAALSVVVAAILAIRSFAGLTTAPFYWLAVVAIRAAGTSGGDFVAGRHGLALGLELSTAVTGALLVAVLLIWRRQPAPALA